MKFELIVIGKKNDATVFSQKLKNLQIDTYCIDDENHLRSV
ncbi:MAG: hypothetical protein NZ516_02275 [Raineya sp.]|nr:hypothetical protein [Raineya sp.]